MKVAVTVQSSERPTMLSERRSTCFGGSTLIRQRPHFSQLVNAGRLAGNGPVTAPNFRMADQPDGIGTATSTERIEYRRLLLH